MLTVFVTRILNLFFRISLAKTWKEKEVKHP